MPTRAPARDRHSPPTGSAVSRLEHAYGLRDGYEEAKGEAAVGTVAFDKFGNPIGALVEDCRVTPKETLWQKLKKHI